MALLFFLSSLWEHKAINSNPLRSTTKLVCSSFHICGILGVCLSNGEGPSAGLKPVLWSVSSAHPLRKCCEEVLSTEAPTEEREAEHSCFPCICYVPSHKVLTSSPGEHSPSTALMPPEVLFANEFSGNRERGEHDCDHSYLMLAHTRGQA